MCDSNHATELHRQKMYSESKEIFTISVPTQSLLQKWLREKRHLHITVFQSNLPTTEPQTTRWEWGYDISKIDDPNNSIKISFNFLSFEKALEDALKECLKLY